ncbi:F-box/WD repeat-containing protein 1A [Podospora conica]|nr:F-box/WD repeat-containing protein 1A [Schizothecium conicum]
MTMANFSTQPDEGYSEDPLNPLPPSQPYSAKPRDEGLSSLALAPSDGYFPDWLTQHIAGLPKHQKTELVMAILSDLPTSVIAQIVEQLNPRLYIDFVRYLPPEVCLKILGYLDPVSLINVARSCRTWYDLALDWKLWEQVYYMEGFKAKEGEIASWERKANGDDALTHDQPDGHAHKKRAISASPPRDGDVDMAGVDTVARSETVDTEMTEFSIFGDPTAKSSISQRMGALDVQSAAARGGSRKGKEIATSPEPDFLLSPKDGLLHKAAASYGLPQAALWMFDSSSKRYKLNWRYLYTLRRRLESNWELGKYTNFQLPHPNHPEEGHGECIYSLQFNEKYLVSGSRDRTLKVWDLETGRCLRTLTKHEGSVLCLQFDSHPDEDIIVSGSSDSNIIVWKFSTGEVVQTLDKAHQESVLNVKFDKRILVTCSKDKTIKVFNRRPLRAGDLGYVEVDAVPITVRYGSSIPISPDDLPVTPPWTLIGVLLGHSAAVNAVQIHEREVVSASGDRHIKVWDWPTQACIRTIVGHNKGIACVQYDGRRIVSGSSDNVVKVFDRQTGLEVASLRGHSNLVRTVQAGFGDLPNSEEEDEAEARKVDANYFKALESGEIDPEYRRTRASGPRPDNAGSKQPKDICAYGAKLPPGGGGGRFGRIVSGSYDTSIIIWRRDKEGRWKAQHHLKQEDAAAAALRRGTRPQRNPPLLPPFASLQHASTPRAAGSTPASTSASGGAVPGSTLAPINAMAQMDTTALAALQPAVAQHYHRLIDAVVQLGPQSLAQALVAHPTILRLRPYVEGAIDRQTSPVVRSQLRQAFSAAMIRAQFEHARQRREALRNQADGAPGNNAPPDDQQQAVAGGSARPLATQANAAQANAAQLSAAAAAAAAAHQAHAPTHGVHLHQLQYDARRIICCSQTSVIVGWDFCNGDPELEEASRFFGHVQ